MLRFFAFLNNYRNFNANKVNEFLDDYLKTVNEDEAFECEKMQTEFLSMLDFVEQYFPKGFRQGKDYAKTTTRIKFESLSVGIALVLREKNDIQPKFTEWLNSKNFKRYTSADGSSSRIKVIKRIEYVRDQLLG